MYVINCLIQKKNTRIRKAISTERRVAVTLWVLATPAKYRSLGHIFGLARCTVCKIVNETCQAIVKSSYLCMFDFLLEMLQLKYLVDLPQCAGSIDGSHVPVTPPAMYHTDYYNRKGWYSMLAQATADHNYLSR